ncbi:hypothetical protein ABL78_6957 [Leptomonas seymouri]|uniref:Uncharacterized protein n=1 Tax=Leptomonas seymouri TaxID=5684 RepID=A0A0N1IIE2_LEPSE|nr:hypothetical protein ABL78_6957 [Leptomonas seymouri]|eukprot:KPI84000.1 hypothetical protein ABL78_6957 [Leptomonas seymouri]
MYAAAAEQLAALRDEQTASRLEVESHMSAFEAAEQQLHAAQLREAQLAESLHAAQQRTAHLMCEFEAAEARLRAAAEHLAETQSLCHYLESQISGHVKCQRSVLLLPSSPACSAPPQLARSSSLLGKEETAREARLPPQLAWMGRYSVLHAPSGKVFSYDLVSALADEETEDIVEAEGSRDGARAGVIGDDSVSDVEDGGVDGASKREALNSLLREVVHDALQGFNYTLLNTSTGAAPLCIASSHSLALMTGPLTHRLSELLQTEAVRRGTRSLSVFLAIGRVVKSSSIGAAQIEDLLRPLVAVDSDAPAGRGRASAAVNSGAQTVLMDAVIQSADDCEVFKSGDVALTAAATDGVRRKSSSRPRFEPKSDGVQHSTRPSKPDHAATQSITSCSTTLIGVQVRSLEEVDDWLEKVGLSASETAESGGLSAGAPSDVRVATAGFDSAVAAPSNSWTNTPFIVLVGVDSQDAAGKVHKSLLRIVSDAAFEADVSAYMPAGSASAMGITAGTRDAADTALQCALSPPATPSLFGLFMFRAVTAVLQAACKWQRRSDTSHITSALLPQGSLHGCDGGEVADLESLVGQLLAAPHSRPSASDIRATVESMLNCPNEEERLRELPSPASTAEHTTQRACDEWGLWAALLRPIFGGNSKALWLHTACSSAEEPSAFRPSRERRGACSSRKGEAKGAVSAASCSVEVALRLCAVFCRLVRHDAVPCEVSADLDRLLRKGAR